MSPLLLSLFFIFNSADTVSIDDVNTKALGSISQSGAKTLIFNFVEPKLTLIDLKTGICKVVDDARYPVMTSLILSSGKGFVLLDGTLKRIYALNDDGVFTSSKSLPPVPSTFPKVRLSTVFLEASGQILANLKGPEKQILARLNLESGTWQELLRRSSDPKRDVQWLPYGSKWLAVEMTTGRLSIVDPGKTADSRPIFKGREPVTKTVGRSPYHGILELAHSVGDEYFFMWKIFLDASGNQLAMPQVVGLVVSGDRCYETERMILGSHNGIELSFDSEERSLVLAEPMKRKRVGGAR